MNFCGGLFAKCDSLAVLCIWPWRAREAGWANRSYGGMLWGRDGVLRGHGGGMQGGWERRSSWANAWVMGTKAVLRSWFERGAYCVCIKVLEELLWHCCLFSWVHKGSSVGKAKCLCWGVCIKGSSWHCWCRDTEFWDLAHGLSPPHPHPLLFQMAIHHRSVIPKMCVLWVAEETYMRLRRQTGV